MGAGTSAGRYGERKRSKAAALREQGQRLLDRADGLDRVAEQWEKGEVGERVVGAALDSLKAQGWIVMHDVRWPGRARANIDHVAVGPPGILVVDAKNWSGKVEVRNGHLKQNGYGRDKYVDAVAAAGDDVGELLDLPWALHVIPVLCVVQPFGRPPANLGAVTVLSAGDLPAWAASLTARLQPSDVEGLGGFLAETLVSASVPAPRASSRQGYGLPVASARTSSVRRHGRTSRSATSGSRRKSGSGTRLLLLRLAVLLALVLAGPTLMRVWLDRGDDLVRQVIPSVTPTAPAPQPVVYDRCRDLRVVHPDGVRAPGERNSGRKLTQRPAIDREAAEANSRLDRDGDGLVCEVTRRGRNGGGAVQ